MSLHLEDQLHGAKCMLSEVSVPQGEQLQVSVEMLPANVIATSKQIEGGKSLCDKDSPSWTYISPDCMALLLRASSDMSMASALPATSPRLCCALCSYTHHHDIIPAAHQASSANADAWHALTLQQV